MEVLNKFVANIIDVYHPSILCKFIQEEQQKVSIEFVLSHNITKLNVLFCKVWNALFGTYPSKKHFQDYLFSIIPLEKAFNSTIQTYDDAVLQSIINSTDIKILCNFGFIALSEYEKVKLVFNEVAPRLTNKEYIKEVMTEKLKFRFGCQNITTHQTLLKTFVLLYNNNINKANQVENKNLTLFSGFTPDVDGNPLKLDDNDNEYMNQREVFQYHMHKNNRFLMQITTHVVIVNDGENVVSHANKLTDIVQDVTKKHALLLNLSEKSGDIKHCENRCRFMYTIPKEYYDLLPMIASQCIMLSDNTIDVVNRPLCKSQPNSILLVLNDNLVQEIDVSRLYHFTLTCSHKKPSAESVYYIPPSTHSLYSWAWKHYLTLKCPFKTPHPMNNTLIFVDFITRYCVRMQKYIMETIQTPPCKEQATKNCIVLVDTRFNIMSLWSMLISLFNAMYANINDVQWKAFIFTSPQALTKYKDAMIEMGLKNIDNVIQIIQYPSLECKVFHMEIYNAFLKNEDFWKGLDEQGYKKCLIVQDDGMLIHGKTLEPYLQYDYVGAPWTDVPDNRYIKEYVNRELVGNGGFSLRDIQKSYQVCATFKNEKNELFYHNINEIPEDVYFVKCLKKMMKDANVAPFNDARRFSIEQVFQHTPCGFHKFWVYHSPQDTQRLCNVWLGY